MNMKNVAVACALMAGMTMTATSAFAAKNVDPTNGKIQFSGTLVNSACGLAPESSPVQVNFGEIPTSQLKDNQHAGTKHAKIMLQGCDTTVAKTATVTYTPATIDPDNAALAAFTSGTAHGAGIGMIDSGNQDVKWGEAASQVNIANGKTDIDFVAYLQANNASDTVTPGDFESTVNFQIDYQ